MCYQGCHHPVPGARSCCGALGESVSPKGRPEPGELSTDPTPMWAKNRFPSSESVNTPPLPHPLPSPVALTHLLWAAAGESPEEQSQVSPACGMKRWVLRGRWGQGTSSVPRCYLVAV